MQDRQLQYLVKVVDQATANLEKISREMERLQTQNQKSVQGAGAASGSMLQMAGAFGIATTAVGILSQTLQLVNREFDASVAAANKYNSAFIGLSSVASAFGEDQDRAKMAAQSLAQDGLMSVAEAAAGLKNLLGTKFSLDESIELMKGFKDAAAFGRQGTLEFGTAIVGATQGIKNQNSIMVDNVGITKNLSIILEEAGYSMNDLYRVTTDAGVRQGLLNGLLREASIFQGDAARAADTLAGSQSTLNTAMERLHNTIGQTLSPALVLFNQTMTGAANEGSEDLIPVMDQIAIAAVQITQAALVAGEALRSMISVGASALSVSRSISNPAGLISEGIAGKDPLGSIKKDFDSIGGEYQKFQERIGKISENSTRLIDKINTQGVGTFANVTRDKLADTASAVDESGKKIADKLEKIQEKIADINRSISEEVTAFTRNMAQATADFDRQIRDLVIKHREEMVSLRKSISELTSDYNDSSRDRLDDYNEKVEAIKKKYEDETTSLRDNLARRSISSKLSDQQLVKFFEAQLKEKDKKRDEELAKEKADYEKQLAKEKEQYEKRLSDLQAKLDAEMAIERKHADDFAKFKDAVAEDDITRAQQAFSRQMDQMRYQHDQRMQELERQLKEEEALKNKYIGTNVTSGQVYKSTGAKAPSSGSSTKSYSTTNNSTSVILNLNGSQQKSVNKDIKNALPLIGWMLG